MKIIVLLGKCASGKTTIRNMLFEKGYKKVVTCTTRPKRAGEVNGVDYFFLTDEEFNKKLTAGDMLESINFNGYQYGTDKNTLKSDDKYIIVLDPEGYKNLKAKLGAKVVFSIYIVVKDNVREQRILNRDGLNYDVTKRYEADEAVFNGIEGIVDFTVENYDLTNSVNLVEEIIEKIYLIN